MRDMRIKFVLFNEKYSQNWQSYIMIKFSTRMFMIIIELKQKRSYSNIIVLFLQFLSGVIDSELIIFFSRKYLIVIFFCFNSKTISLYMVWY